MPEVGGGAISSKRGSESIQYQIVAPILLLCAAVALVSLRAPDWVRNDFERFDDLVLTFFYFILVALACLGYAKLCLEPAPLSKATVVVGAVGAGALLWVSFPVGSKDPFLYALFGRVWGTYHVNPFAVAPAALVADPWAAYVPTLGAQRPAPYGPLFLWQARLVDGLANGHLWAAVWMHKAFATAALAAAIVLAVGLLPGADTAQRWRGVVLLAWNPLLLFESAGNGHNDAVMLVLLMAAARLHALGNRSRVLGAPIMLALAVWYKWYAVALVPAFLIATWREGGWPELRRWMVAMGMVIVALGVALMAPFADAMPLVVERLVGHENLRTVFPMQLSPPLAALLWLCAAAGGSAAANGMLWFDAIRVTLFALSITVVLVAQWRGTLTLTQSVCLLTLAMVTFAFTILWPWHLEIPVAFALLASSPAWILMALGLTCLGLLSYFFTFVWAALALMLVSGAVLLIRWIHPAATALTPQSFPGREPSA